MATFNIEEYLNSLPDDVQVINIRSKNLTYIPSLDRFKKLSKKTIEAIEKHLPLYVKNHIDNDKLQFLPYFEKYINLKKWQDELPYKSKQIETVSKSYSKLNLND
jgi:hypothetical protein